MVGQTVYRQSNAGDADSRLSLPLIARAGLRRWPDSNDQLQELDLPHGEQR